MVCPYKNKIGGINMMKRTIFLLVALMMVLTLIGCGTVSNVLDGAAMEMANFERIDGAKSIYYHRRTNVMYYMFSTYEVAGEQGYGYSYFAPYISENGKYCRYVGGEIVEITE